MDSTPLEIWEKIFSFLSLRDVRSCSRLNKILRSGAIRVIDKLGKVSLKSQTQLFSYIAYLNDGGRLHKDIRLHLTTTELASDEAKYNKILLKIQPSLQKCVLFTYTRVGCGSLDDDPSIRVSDNLLNQVLNICPRFCLDIDPDTCPQYILQFFLSSRLNTLSSIQFSPSNDEIKKPRYETLEKLLFSAVNLRQVLMFPPKPYPMEWPLLTLSSLHGARLEKIKAIGLLVEHGALPEILLDRRLTLKSIIIGGRFSAEKLEEFNADMEKLLKHHATSLEKLTLNFPEIKHSAEISNIQLPEMPKLKDLNLLSRADDTLGCNPLFPSLPVQFPPSLKRIRIRLRFHSQNMLETQLKTLFRHQWWQFGAKFPQIKSIEFSECFSYYPKCRERVGPRILRKINKMFPNAEIRLTDEKFHQKLVVSRLGNREKWGERRR